MFERNDIIRLWNELVTDLAAPRAVLEGFSRPRSLLNWRDGLPRLVIAGAIATMERIEHTEPRLPRRIQNRGHVMNAAVGFCHSPQALPDLAAIGDEIVVWVDHD